MPEGIIEPHYSYCVCPDDHAISAMYRRALKALMENRNEQAQSIAAHALDCIDACSDKEKRKHAQFREAFIAIHDAAQAWL